jgi:hypothetical protein
MTIAKRQIRDLLGLPAYLPAHSRLLCSGQADRAASNSAIEPSTVVRTMLYNSLYGNGRSICRT